MSDVEESNEISVDLFGEILGGDFRKVHHWDVRSCGVDEVFNCTVLCNEVFGQIPASLRI